MCPHSEAAGVKRGGRRVRVSSIGNRAGRAGVSEQQETGSMQIRLATRHDVPRIVQLLADDPLGASREEYADPLPQAYWDAWAAIEADPNQRLVVADDADTVIGVLQLTFIPGLTRLGSWRAQVEGVRVDGSRRGLRLGERLLTWAIDEARARGCRLIQLTTDKQRPDAHRFYERLGFTATHEGMKLQLVP
jgi:GNAT superfamily N-acetyltransferase